MVKSENKQRLGESYELGRSNKYRAVARKDYHCQASDWINNMMGGEDFTPEELVIYKKAKAEKFKILKGTKYLKVDGFWEGEPSVFRARPDMDAICQKYELYRE
jgi:hypothetical protein